MQSEADQPSTLPCVLLKYKQNHYPLFSRLTHGPADQVVLFDGSLDMILSPICDVLRALKDMFDIQNDLTVELPQLKLSFGEFSSHAQVLTLERCFGYLDAVQSLFSEDQKRDEALYFDIYETTCNMQQQLDYLEGLLADEDVPSEEVGPMTYPVSEGEGLAALEPVDGTVPVETHEQTALPTSEELPEFEDEDEFEEWEDESVSEGAMTGDVTLFEPSHADQSLSASLLLLEGHDKGLIASAGLLAGCEPGDQAADQSQYGFAPKRLPLDDVDYTNKRIRV